MLQAKNSRTALTKQDLSILIGNSLDHFDTAIYSFIAPVISEIFFPNYDPIVSLILTYSVFASSLFTRPIGSIVFSVVARNKGAALALSYSLIGLSITTIAIGFIPTYAVLGCFAPFILTIFRMLQGIFAEGEKAIAKLYILENKLHVQAVKASTLYQFSSMVGIILASFAGTLLINYNYSNYWRLCFILGGGSGIIGYNLRKYVYRVEMDQVKPLYYEIRLVRDNKLKIFSVAVVSCFSYVTYSIVFIVMNNFVPGITSISLELMMSYNIILLVVDAGMLLLIGYLIREYNSTRVMMISTAVLFITIVPLWRNIDGSGLWYVNFVRLWIITIGVFFTCSINVWIDSLFENEDKYLLSGIGEAIGSSIGRLTPILCMMLWHFTKFSISIALYIAIIALLTIWIMRANSKLNSPPPADL
ncbi:MAG: Proline/betaine transporter ProP4 [Candidatus Midichloria mitochondrii]|uniref:Proline/betaine transporter ProP4 n=1 Tax=Midichloria mitochondrii (strain IricVA) TaxID=696127 RepID=F7XW29_MIDMI|nr:MFS transporter [Candidatus Midichloria mitochondrii]AEI88878.1 proline/betaine transporter ProP4 [Candidatus Midichloria mitochondrii IricVA]MDJ1256547.1 MFS transporter [Candidatus Midichloria mitochondrii]MDJ1288269.1 MFS transporter [Candidatus Midichloria mitochondrii]MDJ1299148.1 MFS transporter [Candidatus Midichloria mitochondrii]MDJ1313283.1 MFS transporter [Candidatus Midichloria mitochondrii]